MRDKFTIFSVNPSDLLVDNGQFGHLPVAGAGKNLYGKTVIEGRMLLKDLGDDNFQPFEVKARDIAKDVVGRNDSDGLFMTEDGEDPSPARISVERAKFRDACSAQCRHADAIWDRTHNRELIDERARRAARYLNLQPVWADAVAEETKECPWCAERIKARARFCKECKREISPEVEQPTSVVTKK